MSCLDVWVAAFDRLSDALEDYVACCQSINEAPPTAEEITGVDDSTGAPEYDREEDEHPVEFADPAAYDAYLCGVAHRMAEKMDGTVDTVYDIILTTSNILVFATLVVLAFANVIGMAVAAVLAGGYTLVSLGEVFGFFSAMTELREALGGGDPQGLVPQTKAELSAASDDIVDAIFCANDAPAATAALHGVFDANVTSGSYRAILKLMFNGLVMRAAFAGFVNVSDRFDCECVPFEVSFVHDTDQADIQASNDGYNNNGVTRVNLTGPNCFGWSFNLAENDDRLAIIPQNAASHNGYSLPPAYQAFIHRVEVDVCNVYATLRLLIFYADATTDQLDITTTGTHQWDPADTSKPVKNNAGLSSDGFQIRGLAGGGGVVQGIRVYYEIVAT